MNNTRQSRYIVKKVIPSAIEYYRTHPHPMDGVNWSEVFMDQQPIEKLADDEVGFGLAPTKQEGATILYDPHAPPSPPSWFVRVRRKWKRIVDVIFDQDTGY